MLHRRMLENGKNATIWVFLITLTHFINILQVPWGYVTLLLWPWISSIYHNAWKPVGIQWRLVEWINSHAAATAKLLQSCPTLHDPRDSSPPGSAVPGILQARTLGWLTISFSNAWKWKVKVKSFSSVRLFPTPWTAAHQALRPWDSPGKNTGVGCHFLLWICYLGWS